VEQIARIESNADEIGGDKAELSRANPNHADDGAVDRGDHPTLPQFLAEQDRAQNGQNARDIVQTNDVKCFDHCSVRGPAANLTTETWPQCQSLFESALDRRKG